MTIYEYVEYNLRGKKELEEQPLVVSENEAVEAAQLVSGSFTYPFYETMWLNDYPMGTLTAHLEALYDRGDRHGFIYFIILLADSVDFKLPIKFYEMSISDTLIPLLSAAIVEDWLEYDNEYEEIDDTPVWE